MKRIFSFFITLIIIILSAFPANAAQDMAFVISKNAEAEKIPSRLYGINLENSLSDGALASNLTKNNSFEADKLLPASVSISPWQSAGVSLSVEPAAGLNPKNRYYASVSVSGRGEIKNLGFTDLSEKPENKAGGIGFKAGGEYEFSCYINNVDFDGTVSVYLDSENNRKNITQLDISNCGGVWRGISTTLNAEATEKGSLAVEFNGNGTILLDFVNLVPKSSHGFGSEEWKYASLRADLYNALELLSPDFIKFSVSSIGWKNTIGPLAEREQTAGSMPNEINTNSLGIHEYFRLCRDLKAQAAPVIGAGNDERDILDLIEYANGDAERSYWGALRTAHGNKEPFGLKYILVDENYSGDFNKLKKAVVKVYPEITVMSDSEATNFSYTSESTAAADKSDMLAAVQQAHDLITAQDARLITQNTPFFVNADSSANKRGMVLFDSQSVMLTPEFYAFQMLSAIEADSALYPAIADERIFSEGIFDSALIDEKNEIMYIRLVNGTGKKQSVRINIKDFGDIDSFEKTAVTIESNYKSACNKIGKWAAAPGIEAVETADNEIAVSLDKYAVSVIAVSYGGGQNSLNDDFRIGGMPENVSAYIPPAVKIALPCTAVIVLLIIIVFLSAGNKAKKRKK